MVVALIIGSGVNVWDSLSARNEPPRPAVSAVEPWDPEYDDLEPHKALPTWLSYFTAFGLGLALPGLWIVVLLASSVRWQIAAIRASRTNRRARHWSGELGDKTLRGRVVAVDGGADEAILVAIDQRYDEPESEWKETSRRREIRPFTMELAQGQRLRVEPDDRAQLVDALDDPIPAGEGVRRRQVRLTLGEEVCVVGRIELGVDPSAGYRGQSEAPVMRPPRRGRMLLSTGALERLFTGRTRSARTWLMAWLLCFFLPCWLAYFPFWINALWGEPGAATVVSKKRTAVRRDKKQDLQTDVVAFRIEATGQRFWDWLRPSSRSPEIGARVPAFYASSWGAYARVGKTPTVDIKDPKDGLVVFHVFAIVALTVVFGFARWVRPRPWWERKRLDEHLADAREPG